jgi:hypothetical protein
LKRSNPSSRRLTAVLLASAALSGGCSDTQVTTGLAGLSGTYDVVLANRLVFVTSSDEDNLRVLRLDTDPKDFIPAPNPLQALAIPVLERPDALTRDVAYTPGADVSGPYVYARSSGSSLISVVAADINRLTQVGEPLDTGALVTAFAARAPAAEGAPSVLFYALQTPPAGAVGFPCTFGAIMRQELPGPDALEAGERPAPTPVFCLNARESVAAMLVMPQPGQLAVATRSTTSLPPDLPGRTLLLTESPTGGLASITVDLSAGFGGAPVRRLATHPQVTRVQDNPETAVNEEEILTAGRFIYGVRDETACGAGAACSGVLAVESATGAIATDLSGAPMLPITVSGLPTGLAIVPGASVRFRLSDGTDRPAIVPLLGILPSSTGTITLFSASDRRVFDLDIPQASVTLDLRTVAEAAVDRGIENLGSVVNVEQVVEYVNPTDPSRVATRRTLFEGSVPNSIFRIVYQGFFPDLAGLPRDLAAPTLFEVPQPAEPRLQVAVGDIILLESDDAVCGTDLPVTAVVPTSEGRVRLETATPIPDVCAGLTRFSVLAGGDQPFLLIDAAGQLLARNIAGLTAGYSIPTSYFFHPADLLGTVEVDDNTEAGPGPWSVPAYPATPPDITIRVASPSVATRLVRGDRFVATLNSGIRTYTFGVGNDAQRANLTFYTLPGPVVAEPGSNLAYIAYPSADGILQVNLNLVQDNVLNIQALDPYE